MTRSYLVWISVASSASYPSIHGICSLVVGQFGILLALLTHVPQILGIRRRFKTVLDQLRSQLHDFQEEEAASPENRENTERTRRGEMIARLEVAITKLDDQLNDTKKLIKIMPIIVSIQLIPQLWAYAEYWNVVNESLRFLAHEVQQKMFVESKVMPVRGKTIACQVSSKEKVRKVEDGEGLFPSTITDETT